MPRDSKSVVTAGQTDVLCTFFEDNPEVIKGYKKTPKGINAVQSKWKKITPHLNSLGAARDHKSWAKYLCNVKAKLKRKHIKWRQSPESSGPIICNADDFNEIELRMLQVLRKKMLDIQEPQDCNMSDVDTEDYIKLDKDEDNVDADYTDTELSNKSINHTYIKLLDADSPLLDTQVPQVIIDNGDEFDTFGRNIAQQLKALPLPVALETQEMLLSVIRKQRLKVLSNSR